MINFDRLLNLPISKVLGQSVIIRHKAGGTSTVSEFDYRHNAAPESGGGDAEYQAFEYSGGFRLVEAPDMKQGDFIDLAAGTFTVDQIDPDDTGWVEVGLLKGEVSNV
ncbi:head-tail joining protein [Thalassospira lucentensis]|uniref:head-tail joining protein n=1 Tax=Thalassospira lucentensis TaxID=168935 RepID=UPI003D2D1DA8